MASTPLSRSLIDTTILIAYREGWPDAAQFVMEMRKCGQPEFSQISALALFAWGQDVSDVSAVQTFLTITTVHAVTAHTIRRAFRLIEKLPPPSPSPLTADDAIVVATAIEHSLPLYTLDPVRFAAVPGLTAIKPY